MTFTTNILTAYTNQFYYELTESCMKVYADFIVILFIFVDMPNVGIVKAK